MITRPHMPIFSQFNNEAKFAEDLFSAARKKVKTFEQERWNVFLVNDLRVKITQDGYEFRDQTGAQRQSTNCSDVLDAALIADPRKG